MLTHLDISRTRNRNDIISLREKPGKCNLARCGVVSLSNVGKNIDEFVNVREVLLGESRYPGQSKLHDPVR